MTKKREVPEAQNEEELEIPVEISIEDSELPAIPAELPILPLRGVVVFPQTRHSIDGGTAAQY